MAIITLDDAGIGGGTTSGGTGGEASLSDLPEFSMTSGAANFFPEYYPERVRVGKQRELSRNPGLCDDEEVNDIGSKNREIHLSGYILESEKQSFNFMLDSGEEFKLVSMPWSGHCVIKDSKLEGPLGIENHPTLGKQWVYEYTLDLVASESGEQGDGILTGSSGGPNRNVHGVI